MKLSLNCPSCGKAIASTKHRSAPAQVDCLACGQKYGVVYGKLSKRSSIQEALLYLKASLPSFYKRHYTFQITTAERTLKSLQFSVPGKADVVPVHRGDIVSVLYTMQGYVMKQLVAIANHTTGKQYVLPNPVSSSSHHVTILTVFITGVVTLSSLGGINLVLPAVLSALGVLVYLKLTHSAQLSSPTLEGQERDGRRLLADQKLMAQQRKIEERIGELKHECQSNQMLIQQVEGLKQKMAQVDQALYSARIYRATTAINILHQQNANNQRLMREYDRTLKMVDIEIETSWIADQLPDAENFTRKILERLSELREIEDQNQSLKLQLSAYEEVKLLRIDQYEANS